MATIVQRFSEGAYIITDTGEEILVYEGMEILPEDQLVGDIVTLDVEVARDPGADPTTIPADDIAAIQQAILEGADPTQVSESTAAGAGDSTINTEDGGSSFIALDRTGNEVDPNAGYDTIPINFFAEESINDTNGLTELASTDGVDTPTDTGPNIPEQPDGPSSNPDSPDSPEEPDTPKEPPVEPEEPEQPEEDNSGQNNGWGNGDQDAPGNSGDNNQAENSDNDPPPGISNNPNISNNVSEDSDEQDSGDTTETANNGDNTDNLHDGDSIPSGDVVDVPTGQNPGNDKEVGNSPHDGNKGASNDDESPLDAKDILDDEEDIIPGLDKDKVKEDNPNKGKNNGWGNGDQDAPGNSLDNNSAENNLDGLLSPTEQYYDS